MECEPGASQTTLSDATGQGRPSTSAGPLQIAPTPARDSTTNLSFFSPEERSARWTEAAADGSSGRSGARIEFSKYTAIRGNAAAATCSRANSSEPVCCLVG